MKQFYSKCLNRRWRLLGLVLVLTCCIFWPAVSHDFVDWDDSALLTENPALVSASLTHVGYIFSQKIAHTYVPLTVLTLALEKWIFGLDPFVFHLSNVLWHLVVVFLIFVMAGRMGLPPAAQALAALIFALHPVHVEPVAWVSGRKDLVYAACYLLAFWQYDTYVRNREKRYYVYCVVWGMLSILAKPMAISLPLFLTVYDVYCRRRLDRGVVLEKAGILAVMLPVLAMTLKEGLSYQIPLSDAVSGGWWQGILIGIWSLGFYVRQMFFPVQVLPHYLLPEPVSWGQPAYFLSLLAILLAGVTLFVGRRDRLYQFAWASFFVQIFFLLRVVDVQQLGNYSLVADRFLYLPIAGMCCFAGRLACDVWQAVRRVAWRKYTVAAAGTVVLVLGIVQTRQVIGVWQDSFSLWDVVLRHEPEDFLALTNRGMWRFKHGQPKKGLADLELAAGVNPRSALALTNVGWAWARSGRHDLAMMYYHRALAESPRYVMAVVNQAVVLFEQGKREESLDMLNRALQIDNGNGMAYAYRAIIFHHQGDLKQAEQDFATALRLNPYDVDTLLNRAVFFYYTGQRDRALQDLDRVIKYRPRTGQAYFLRSQLYAEHHHWQQAYDNALKAQHLGIQEASSYVQKWRSRLGAAEGAE